MDEYARHLCTCICPSSFFRSLSLCLSHLLALSISLLFSHLRTVWWGAKDVCASQGATTVGSGTRQGHGYQALVSLSFSLSLLPVLFFHRSHPFPLPPPAAYLFPFFITVPSFSFSFPLHLESSSLHSFFLSLFLSSQRGSHLGECVASSNAPSRITINYLLRYLSPSTSPPARSSRSCNLHSLGPMRRVTLREEMKDFHCARNRSSARFCAPRFSFVFPLCRLICFAASSDVSIRLIASKSIGRAYDSAMQ